MSRPNKWVGMAPQLCHRCATYIANYILNRPKRWSIKKTFSNSPEKYLLIKLFGKHELHKMCVFERKNSQFTTALPFLGHLKKSVSFWPILFAQNIWTEILFVQRKILLESLNVYYTWVNIFYIYLCILLDT